MRGLLLTGGGARAAYQAGVLRRIWELSREEDGRIPFEILVGVSAGAINLAAAAAHADDFTRALAVMERRWGTVTTDSVFRTHVPGLALNALRWLGDLLLAGAQSRPRRRARSLVDTTPLADLLADVLPAGAIGRQLRHGILRAVAVTATEYSTGALKIFVESEAQRTLWQRHARSATYATLTPAHILASCSLPILFPAVRIGNAYYGDGSIRNTAPLSPAIHLGARRILAIGVRAGLDPEALSSSPLAIPEYPSPAQISGTLLNAIFFDALEEDREHMGRTNRMLSLLRGSSRRIERSGARVPWKRVDYLYIGPSEDLGEVATEHRRELPRSVRYLLRGIGTEGYGGSDLLSYLLFEWGYCRELMELGYADANARADEIEEFIYGELERTG